MTSDIIIMPYVRRSRRMRKSRRPRYGRRIKRFTKKTTMVNRMPRRLKTVVAPKYFTTIEASMLGVFTIESTPQFAYFSVSANGPVAPFIQTVPSNSKFTDIAGAVLSGTTLSISDITSTGIRQLRDLYDYVRVHSVAISVTITPTNGQDMLELCVVPYNGQNSGNPPLTFYEAKSAPWSKTITCTGFNNIKQNTVFMKVKPRDILGQSKEQYRTDDDNLTSLAGDSLPTIPVGILILYNRYSTGTFNGPCNIGIKLKYYCEFTRPIQALSVDDS